jgi:hypothetical protein
MASELEGSYEGNYSSLNFNEFFALVLFTCSYYTRGLILLRLLSYRHVRNERE